jgi:hypothetical protein
MYSLGLVAQNLRIRCRETDLFVITSLDTRPEAEFVDHRVGYYCVKKGFICDSHFQNKALHVERAVLQWVDTVWNICNV